MVNDPIQRRPFDVDRYVEQITDRPCFICELAAQRTPNHAVVYRDNRHIAFLNAYPTLIGYTLVAPIEHREQVIGDFDVESYLALQELIHRIGRALTTVLDVERLYVLSLGSQQGNSHVHWHVAPLPPGVPLRDQQYYALMAEREGYLDLTDEQQIDLARRINAAM